MKSSAKTKIHCASAYLSCSPLPCANSRRECLIVSVSPTVGEPRTSPSTVTLSGRARPGTESSSDVGSVRSDVLMSEE